MIVPRAIAGAAEIRSDRVRHQAGDLGVEDIAALGRKLEIADDLRESEHAHGDIGEPDAVGQLRDVEGHAAGAGFEVGADHRQQQPHEDHGDGFEHRALGQHDREDQAEHHQREVFGRPEQQREARQWCAERGNQHRGHATREERADGGDGERRSRPALLRHLMAVETGDDRRRLARDVDQNRGGRAAVLRAVIDAGKHDQSADGRQPEGDRQQHRYGGDCSDAGQHPDQGADQGTDHAEQEVVRSKRDPEAQIKVGEQVRHESGLPRQNRGQSWNGRLSR